MRVLGWIGAFLHWLEELVTMASGPLLTAGLAIALIDLLTDGQLLASQPALLYGWAISQAIGVDGQLVGASVKAGRAVRQGRPGIAAAYVPLIAALGVVAYMASNVFATQQALGLTTRSALALLGMSPTLWIVVRSALAVGLVILSGFLRFEERAVAATESDAEYAARQRRELQDAQHRAALRTATWSGIGAAARATVQAAKHDEVPVEDAPATEAQDAQESAEDAPDEARTLRPRPAAARGVPAGKMSSRQFLALLSDNGVSITDEKARAIVLGAAGFEKVGTAYCADRRALMAVANRMIKAAQPAAALVG